MKSQDCRTTDLKKKENTVQHIWCSGFCSCRPGDNPLIAWLWLPAGRTFTGPTGLQRSCWRGEGRGQDGCVEGAGPVWYAHPKGSFRYEEDPTRVPPTTTKPTAHCICAEDNSAITWLCLHKGAAQWWSNCGAHTSWCPTSWPTEITVLNRCSSRAQCKDSRLKCTPDSL